MVNNHSLSQSHNLAIKDLFKEDSDQNLKLVDLVQVCLEGANLNQLALCLEEHQTVHSLWIALLGELNLFLRLEEEILLEIRSKHSQEWLKLDSEYKIQAQGSEQDQVSSDNNKMRQRVCNQSVEDSLVSHKPDHQYLVKITKVFKTRHLDKTTQALT